MTAEDVLEELITTYNELNATVVEELSEEPSPLAFARYVARNTPFVVRGGARSWPAYEKWNASYLTATLGSQPVNVAVTPLGNADSPLQVHKKTVFVKPHEESQPFHELLAYIIRQERQNEGAEIRYAQTHEYQTLLKDVPGDIPFARIALEQSGPDAANLWIGNSRSVTALHRDNYENIYVQIRGRKHFVLLSPTSVACVHEKPLPPAHYRRCGEGDELDAGTGLLLEMEADGEDVPFATWDPDHPTQNATPWSHLAQPVRITLEPGDMMYLPAMWYHKVSQSCRAEDEGFVLAVNYWYDMDFSGPLYPLCNLARRLASQATHNDAKVESVR